MLAIRLTRMGAKKRPFYRIIVTDKENKRDGRFIEIIGHYDPCSSSANVKLDTNRVKYWLACGAQPTATVLKIIKRQPQPIAEATPEATTKTVAV